MGIFEPQRSYKQGSYKKKACIVHGRICWTHRKGCTRFIIRPYISVASGNAAVGQFGLLGLNQVDRPLDVDKRIIYITY